MSYEQLEASVTFSPNITEWTDVFYLDILCIHILEDEFKFPSRYDTWNTIAITWYFSVKGLLCSMID